jgi:DNA ligase (NAD+)
MDKSKKDKRLSEDPEYKRLLQLVSQLQRYNDLYYNQGKPEVTDSEYDRMFRELETIEDAHPEWILPDSPTQEVGASPRRGFRQVRHRIPMLSLDSLTSEDEVRAFVDRIAKGLGLPSSDLVEFSLEPKFDGVSASLLYKKGELIQGLTRGDGEVGEDITRNLRMVGGIPDQLIGDFVPDLVEVRGEVMLSKSRFHEIREQQENRGEEPFRNARNAVAGSLKRIRSKGLKGLGMTFHFWGVGELVGMDFVKTYVELARYFEKYGFQIAEELEVGKGAEGIISYHHRLEACRDRIDFEMDGIVAKVNSLAQERELGRTARAPRWALAYKYAPRQGRTKVLDIVVQVGRTGVLTPVANLKPLDLAGVTIQRASLHNFDWLEEMDVQIGDSVIIERAGDVIPEIVRVLKEFRTKAQKPFQLPESCPECGSRLEKEGAFLLCTNIDCPAQIRQRIVHLASRRALDIDRLGPKYVDQLFSAGILQKVEDVFTLPSRKKEVLALERWGEQSFDNLVREIERAKKPELAKFLYSLGIRHVGEKTAFDLAERFKSLENLRRASEAVLSEVEGVGPIVAHSVFQFFRLPSNQKFLEALKENGVEILSTRKHEGPLEGRVFLFTGGLESMSRDQARDRIEQLGGESSTSVTRRVTDVVVGKSSGSKRRKAEEMGLRILSEQEFLALLEAFSGK